MIDRPAVRNINIGFFSPVSLRPPFHVIARPCPHIAAAYNGRPRISDDRHRRTDPRRVDQLHHIVPDEPAVSGQICRHGKLTPLLMQTFQIGKKGVEEQKHGKHIDHEKQEQRNRKGSLHRHGPLRLHGRTAGSRPGHPLCRLFPGRRMEHMMCLSESENKRSENHGLS